jgi:hypothetical protein
MNIILPTTRDVLWKPWLRWSLSFAGFPLAGVVARAAAGPIDTPLSAALGGLAAGAVLGAVQAAARESSARRKVAWTAATSLGMGVGLALGASSVDYRTSPSALVTMGALTGAAVGIAQAAVGEMTAARRALWAIATPCLWALGWFITAHVIVDDDRQHAVFGSTGALAVTALSGLIVNQFTQNGPTAEKKGLQRANRLARVNEHSLR